MQLKEETRQPNDQACLLHFGANLA